MAVSADGAAQLHEIVRGEGELLGPLVVGQRAKKLGRFRFSPFSRQSGKIICSSLL